MLNMALPTPLVRPLCQKPPSPIIEITRLPMFGATPAALASPMPYPSTVLPRLNGGSVENVWQPMSAAMWVGPISFSRILMALNTGRSGQPVQNDGGRVGIGSPNSSVARVLLAISAASRVATTAASTPSGVVPAMKPPRPFSTTSEVYSPAIGSTSLPNTRVCRSALRSATLTACSRKSGWPSSTISTAFLPAQKSVISAGTSG